MGYIQHDAVIVTFRADDPLPDIDAFRASLPEPMRHLVIGPVESVVNGYYTYVFAPDGSKEGWAESDEGDDQRARFKDLFRGIHSSWVHVRYGGDFAAEFDGPQIVEFSR